MDIRRHLSVYKGLPRDIYVLFISTVINKMGSFIVPLMTLILTEKIGFSKYEAGLFTTIAILSQAPFLVVGGSLVDRFGSKRIIVIFQSLGSLLYLTCGFMKPTVAVAVLIVIASNLYALATPAFNAMVPSITPKALMKNAYSLMYLGSNLGLAIGPMIGGILFSKNYLNLLFILDATTTIISTMMVFFFVRGKAKLSISLAKGETSGTKAESSESIFSFIVKNPVIIAFSLIMLVYYFCYVQWNFLLPLQTVEVFGKAGVSVFSSLFSINAITVIVLTPILTSITAKTYPLKSMFVGGILYFIAFGMFAINRYILIFVAAIIIMTVGEILITINSNNYIAQRTPKQYLGRVNSMFFLFMGAGFATGPLVMGSVLTFVNFQYAWIIVSALMLFGATLMYWLKFIEKKSDKKSLEDDYDEYNEIASND
ncbi:MFS transporter [Clostridium fungisolvens]|uniref:Enterobactin exporter EntS n=1 Tax=Clostridium fungisolvens TaxID=1604897 RepID=A0A6V8SL76_9CLOT|nr:MFS transporter [Clostridium fungisolvens]GFP75623.1 Enterobactin exporter EntS [Clostridium fungisolvens]